MPRYPIVIKLINHRMFDAAACSAGFGLYAQMDQQCAGDSKMRGNDRVARDPAVPIPHPRLKLAERAEFVGEKGQSGPS